ncbi:MAG: DUF1566 domain-containing protein [bacterium]|nr:DUF1566 domain-containing protein [bacterium]
MMINIMRTKNRWRVCNIYTGEIRSVDVGRQQQKWQDKMYKMLKPIAVVLVSILVVVTVVKAGSITPPSGTPSAQFYSLNEIYTRLITNGAATGHSFDFSDSLVGTGRTLTEIYNAIPTIDASKILSGATYLGIPGTIADNGVFSLTATVSDQTVDAGYYSGGTLLGDAYLISSNIRSGINIFGVAGNSNVVNTSSGDAAEANVLSGNICWVDGSEVTGSMASVGAQEITPTTTNTTITQGYHNGSGYCGGDADLVAGNIAANANIFGVAGTLLKNQYNGSATTPATDFAFWTQALGGVDDYNDGVAGLPTGAYVGQWQTCTSGADNWCGTGDSNADKKDLSTGLVWSTNINSGNALTWFVANSCYPPGTPTYNPTACAADGDDGCQCVRLPAGSETGCLDLGDGGWRLPYQKELMQAYINGSWTNLTAAGYLYWSSTTHSSTTHDAWRVSLTNGHTGYYLKTNADSYRARCIR